MRKNNTKKLGVNTYADKETDFLLLLLFFPSFFARNRKKKHKLIRKSIRIKYEGKKEIEKKKHKLY